MQKISQQLCVFDGDGLAEAVVLVGEADAVVLVAEAVADVLAAAELVCCSGVEDLLGDGELEAVCVGLAEALVARAEDAGIVVETVIVNDAALPVPEPCTATTLPAVDPSVPPPLLPYTRNATTTMPAKPPVSISPIPRRFSCRRALRDRLASSAAARAARRPLSLPSSATDMPRRPPPADLAALTPVASSASETTESRGLSVCRPRPASCSGPVTTSPSYGSASGTGRRAGDLARRGPLTGGNCTGERPSRTLESSRPVAPHPGQDTAPFRCLRQVLQ